MLFAILNKVLCVHKQRLTAKKKEKEKRKSEDLIGVLFVCLCVWLCARPGPHSGSGRILNSAVCGARRTACRVRPAYTDARPEEASDRCDPALRRPPGVSICIEDAGCPDAPALRFEPA